jgi:hypothetical protein
MSELMDKKLTVTNRIQWDAAIGAAGVLSWWEVMEFWRTGTGTSPATQYKGSQMNGIVSSWMARITDNDRIISCTSWSLIYMARSWSGITVTIELCDHYITPTISELILRISRHKSLTLMAKIQINLSQWWSQHNLPNHITLCCLIISHCVGDTKP